MTAWTAVRGAAWRTPWGGVGPADPPASDDDTVVGGGPLGVAAPARGVLRLLDDIARFAIAAGQQVWRDAGAPSGERLGLFVGSGGLRASWSELWGGMQQQGKDGDDSWARGLGRMHPLWVLRFLPNNAHGLLAAAIGARGEGVVCSGPLGGAEALMCAQAALLDGAIDDAIVVAYDATAAAEVALDRRRGGDARAGMAAAVALHLTRADGGAGVLCSVDVQRGAPPAGAAIAGDHGVDQGAAWLPLDLARASVGKLRHEPAADDPAPPPTLELWYPGAMDGAARLRIRTGTR